MKYLPTERTMGLITLLSGLAIPIAITIGAGPLGQESRSVAVFEGLIWFVNPAGMWVVDHDWQFPDDLLKVVVLYILGTALSAVSWGFIDAFFRRKKRARQSPQ